MEVAKVTSKGQITIPVSIRRRLGINEGDRLLFIDRPDGVIMVNPNTLRQERFDDFSDLEQTSQEQYPASETAAARASQPMSESQPVSAAASEKHIEGSAQETQKKSAALTPREDGFDVAALLNEIRSIGSIT